MGRIKSRRPEERPGGLPPARGGQVGITKQQLAVALRRSVDTVEIWVREGRIPSPVYSTTGWVYWPTATATRIVADGPAVPGTHPVAESPRRRQLLEAIERRKALGFLPPDPPPPTPRPTPRPTPTRDKMVAAAKRGGHTKTARKRRAK